MPQEEVLVKCTNCGTALRVFASDIDRIIKCNVCQNFTKVPGKLQKRMEVQCSNPACNTVLNIPVRLRGKFYKCWNCHLEMQLPVPAELNIDEIALVDQIEQGGVNNEITITVSNPGTPALITAIQIIFENSGNDVTSTYAVTPFIEEACQVDYTKPLVLKCEVNTTPHTPAGPTTIYVDVTGQDFFDDSPLAGKATVNWNVVPKRGFAIATEHDSNETAGVAFAMQLWACVAGGDLDPTYEGAHYIQFTTTATESALGVAPKIPQRLKVEFHNGVGVTEREFVLYNATETSQITAWEDALGGPNGISQAIQAVPGILNAFEVAIASPQIDQCPFQGENLVYAIDRYGNLVAAFHEDIWMYSASNMGDICGEELAPNIIPGKAFQDGVASLTALRFVYSANTNEKLPKKESFIISYQEKEGCSEEVVIEPNPVQVAIDTKVVPRIIEQGEEIVFDLPVSNLTKDSAIVIHDISYRFWNKTGSLEQYYQLYWKNHGVECAEAQSVSLGFQVQPTADAPVGPTNTEIVLYIKDAQNRLYGKASASFDWTVEPKGRNFQIISPAPRCVEAGKKFGLQIAAYFQGKLDTSYSGKRLLKCVSNANPSPNGVMPEIPPQAEITFSGGTGKTAEQFCFTNTGESPTLKFHDNAPGGAHSEEIAFTVVPSVLNSFLVSLQDSLINGDKFGELNQILALDHCGNLKYDFAKNCSIYMASQRGKLQLQGKTITNIPAEAFAEGIVELGELEMAYLCDIQEKLPKQEELVVECEGKKAKSGAIKILPRNAKISIIRCSAPNEIEPGGKEYPLYLELENVGDLSANISSVLFSFEQKSDVSANYTIIANSGNANLLIPGVPLQLAYTVRSGPKTPVGTTKIEVKVTGLETESKTPLQAKISFEWIVESGQRSYRASTEHGNMEEAGTPFGLKIDAYVENDKDTRFNGEVTLFFRGNAASAPNGKPATLPEKLTVNFKSGEARTPAMFVLVNTQQPQIIKLADASGKAEGQTDIIRLQPAAPDSFQVKLGAKIREKEVWEGANTITVFDAFGNLKEDFAQDIGLAIEGVQGSLMDDKQQKLNRIPGEWFQRGMADLGLHKLQLICSAEQKLPGHGYLILSYGSKKVRSSELEIMGRPITVTLDNIQVAPRVVQGQRLSVTVMLNNKGTTEVPLASVDITFTKDDQIYRYPVKADIHNGSHLFPGNNPLVYWISLSADAAYGKMSGKAAVKLQSAQGAEIAVEGVFSCQIEPASRQFIVLTENRQKETAGIPFALKIATNLQGKLDSSYEGVRSLVFSSKATPGVFGQAACIPKLVKVEFHAGEVVSSRDFILFNALEQATIEIKEDLAGGPIGATDAITLKPGGIQEFRWALSKLQTNTFPFQNPNQLIAIDAFGNVKSDFQEDVRVHTASQKGDVSIAGTNIFNIIPGHTFQGGMVDLTALKLCYRISRPDYLPLQERLIASYGEKKGESEEVTIQPRPLTMAVNKISFTTQVFQGESGKALSFVVKNSGDIPLRITQVMFIFDNNGKDVSSGFSITADSHNSPALAAESENVLNYFIEAASNVEVGQVKLTVAVQAVSTKQDERVETNGSNQFEVLEKLREFVLATQHDNLEIVGEPFAIKINVLRDGQLDSSYEGQRQISFKSTAKPSDTHPFTCPATETVEFVKGIGQTGPSFIFTSTAERPVVTAEEKGKSQGTSAEIGLKPGPMQSIKISFESKKGGYNLNALDRFNNVLDTSYKINEDIKTGVILTGSEGNFYEILEIIGYGGMGKVYKARRFNDDALVAVKTTMFSSLGEIGRFLQEGELLIRFDHPNIVKGYDMGEVCIRKGGRVEIELFMVMEFLPGHSVKRLIDSAKLGVLDPLWATEIICQVSRGLAYIWEHKTMHRDIKPDNIQITEDHRIKLIDLGIAKAEGVDINLTNPGTVVGSYPYISPERLKDIGVDFRSDIYSLGATYYHMVTGMPPYLDTYQGSGGKDLLEYLMNVRIKKMPTPPNKIQEMPMSVVNVIMTMLQIKTVKRYNTPDDLLKAMEQLHQELKS